MTVPALHEPNEPNARFDQLLEALLDGELPPDGVAELDVLLADDARRTEARERLAQHRLLGLVHQGSNHGELVDGVVAATSASDDAQIDGIMARLPRPLPEAFTDPFGTRPTTARAAAVCVAAALLLMIGLMVFRPTESPPVARSSSPADPTLPSGTTVATLVVAEDCRWDGDDRAEGDRLHPQTLHLTDGFAIVRFDGGAEAALSAPSRLALVSSGAARLLAGRVVVRAPEEAAGFVLLTPESELLDLGTEFSVRVSDGGTTLDVLEGEVAVRPLETDAEAQVLSAGQAVTVDTPQSPPREVAATAPRFAAVVEGAGLRSRWGLTHAYEGFHYPPGRVPLKASVRGKGWVGPWRARRGKERQRGHDDTAEDLRIVSGMMNVTWPVPGGRAGMLELPAGSTTWIRQIARPIDLDADRTVFFSMMVREPAHPTPVKAAAKPREAVRLTFRSSDDYFGQTVSFGLSSKQLPQILTGQGVGTRGASRAPSDQSTLWLGKLVARHDGPDQARLRIFRETDELGFAEPGEWDVVADGLDLSATLDLVVLTSTGQSPRIVDELRIGPTFRSVAPMPEPVETDASPALREDKDTPRATP